MKKIIKKIIKLGEDVFLRLKVILNNIIKQNKWALLDKIIEVLIRFYYVVAILLIILLCYYIITTSLTWSKVLLSLTVIIIILMLRQSKRYIKNIKKEIDEALDKTQIKKEVIFYLTLQMFISLIIANISIFVFFWIYCYIASPEDCLGIQDELLNILLTLGMFKERAIYIRVIIFTMSIITYYAFYANITKEIYRKKERKRLKEEIEEDKMIIELARKRPKMYIYLIKKRWYIEWILMISLITSMMKDINKIIIIISLILLVSSIIIIIYMWINEYLFDRKVYKLLWKRCYKANPGPDDYKTRKKYIKYKGKMKKTITNNGGGVLRNKYVTGLIGLWGALVVGQWTWDMFHDSEKNMYPPKKVTREIGKYVKIKTGWPKDKDNDKDD
jgi:hypothetical protein